MSYLAVDLAHITSGVADAGPLVQALERMERAVDGPVGSLHAEAERLSLAADRAGCPELAIIARMLAAGTAKADPRSLVALARKALDARVALGRRAAASTLTPPGPPWRAGAALRSTPGPWRR